MFHATTIVGVRRGGKVALAGDGQVTAGNTVMKADARKVRRIYGDRVLCGFAGSVADAVTLLEKFESKLDEFHGNLSRAAVELAKEWRTNRMLRQLEAMLIVADNDRMLVVSGTGEVVEPEGGVAAIGSGGPYALAAARALVAETELSAVDVARKAMEIAGDICIYTNRNITVEEL